MPSRLGISSRTKTDFQMIDGRWVRGHIDTPTDRQPPAYQFLHPRRIFITDAQAECAAGDIICTAMGRRYLLADNGDAEFANRTLYKTYRLVEMTHELTWSRPMHVVDPVTGLERTDVYETLPTVHAAVESLQESLDREIRVWEEKYRVITNANLMIHDMLGEWKVRRVERILGLTVAEVY